MLDKYDKLWNISKKLDAYYGIDKVKSYAVFVYSKDSEMDIFDIYKDKLVFYNGFKEDNINDEALVIIKEIQDQLKVIDKE